MLTSRNIKSVLFVCHGNISRSPMAEFIFKKMVRDAGLAVDGEAVNGGEDVFRVDSAAVSFEEIGNDIYPSAKWTLAVHGFLSDGIPLIRFWMRKPLGMTLLSLWILPTGGRFRGLSVWRVCLKSIVCWNMTGRPQMCPILGTREIPKGLTVRFPRGKVLKCFVGTLCGDSERTCRDISEGCAGLLESLKTE